MYDQIARTQEAQSHEGTATGLLAGNSPIASSALQRALNEHGEQLEKLASLVNTLTNRLEPVRVPVNQADGSENAMTEPVTSMVVGQLTAQTRNVKYLQQEVSSLLAELEV